MIRSFFSLRNSRKILKNIHLRYLKKQKILDEKARVSVEGYLKDLHDAISKKDSLAAEKKAKDLKNLSSFLIPRTRIERFKDFVLGLGFALFVAVLVRTTWFELYVIPTGSMRPTLKEEDYLIVSKSDYGINVPLQEKHFYFDEKLIQRGSTIVFNGANMNIADADTVYFYLFPGKKQFVKRLIGKPGDTLYFYGGHLYGIDAAGNRIEEFQKEPWFQNLEHIPFIRFEGKVESSFSKEQALILHQMNLPLVKLSLNHQHETYFSGSEYSHLWGMKNFAMARVLTPQELFLIHPEENVEPSPLYLELTHHPTLKGATFPNLAVSSSILPLKEEHIRSICEHMTTCRFHVKQRRMSRPGYSSAKNKEHFPLLKNVPDGVYEMQDGKAYKLPFMRIPFIGIFTNGFSKELASDHPLYSQDIEHVHTLYNLGFEPFKEYLPRYKKQRWTPSRYAYFRDGDLYLMGGKVFSKEDPLLKAFVEKEKLRPYPFVDASPPSLEEIRKFGLRVPEKMYLALGDNHAMSSDSRDFGFVPEDNLKGSVSFLFSPPGSRWGTLSQPYRPKIVFPNIVIWTVFLSSFVAYSLYMKRRQIKL